MTRSRIVPLPAALRAVLTELFGAGVEEIRIIEHSRFARLHARAVATTRRGRIYLRGSAADFFGDPALVLHEYCHVMQQWAPRRLTTLRYVLEWLRRGYWNNRFEVEARRFVEQNAARFHGLLARAAASEQRLAVVEPSRDGREQRPERERRRDG
jgi:hypothetical protein